jgi:hypothetical protein
MNIIITTISNGVIVWQTIPEDAPFLHQAEHEGVTWIRGWHKPDSKEAAAMLVANALGKDQQSDPYADNFIDAR